MVFVRASILNNSVFWYEKKKAPGALKHRFDTFNFGKFSSETTQIDNSLASNTSGRRSLKQLF